jgi:hypothetical protein
MDLKTELNPLSLLEMYQGGKKSNSLENLGQLPGHKHAANQ